MGVLLCSVKSATLLLKMDETNSKKKACTIRKFTPLGVRPSSLFEIRPLSHLPTLMPSPQKIKIYSISVDLIMIRVLNILSRILHYWEASSHL